MSTAVIRKGLELWLNAHAGGVDIAFENVPYQSKPGTPYQEVHLLVGRTIAPTMENDFKRENGIFQITLNYPTNTGPSDCEARADALCATFNRGITFAQGSTTVKVLEEPFQSPGTTNGGWYTKVVSVPYIADTFGVGN
jgi:hypothetical protein